MFLFCFSRTTQHKDTPYVLKNNYFRIKTSNAKTNRKSGDYRAT